MARLLDLLIASANKRVTDDSYPGLPKPALSLEVRNWLRRRAHATHVIKRIDAALERRGLALRSSRNTKVSLSYERERRHQTDWNTTQKQRLARVRNLRDKAMLDLIDMAPKAQKAYYIKLKRQLQEI